MVPDVLHASARVSLALREVCSYYLFFVTAITLANPARMTATTSFIKSNDSEFPKSHACQIITMSDTIHGYHLLIFIALVRIAVVLTDAPK